MSGQPTTLQLRVAEARELNPLIRLFRLCPPDGGTLPGYSAGAHIRVQVALADGSADWRHYSLVNPVGELAATEAPAEYVIAVRRERSAMPAAMAAATSGFLMRRLVEPLSSERPVRRAAAAAFRSTRYSSTNRRRRGVIAMSAVLAV